MLYYIKVRGKPRHVRKSVAHLWVNGDTACTMYSTGGLTPDTYELTEDKGDKKVCELCMNSVYPGKYVQ